MSLPTCPSCGQSVLEDNAVDCPFCGAAMDGSRGAKNTPRPKANPVANRPGARKMPEKPAAATPPSASAEPPKPVARPATAGRAGKPMVDEDDPFGIGGAAAAAQAIQATIKPEKGRLHRVVCPMCEQAGFVPKSAIGKSVRCANDKCMVPVFTAPDPSEHGGERKPVRLSDEAEAARKAAESARPRKRNPLMIYGIVGAVLLVVTIVVLPMVTKPPSTDGLNKPVNIKDFGPDEEELALKKKQEEDRLKAAADAVNPVVEVAAHVKRMITAARQPNLRDKAWARRMTGDLYLRMGDANLASQEFSHLLVVDKERGYYRLDPHLTRHWRALAAGDAETAKKALADAMAESPAVARTGRLGIEAALGMAAALANDGKADQATQLVAQRQLDTTIPDNRDLMASTAWSFVASRCRDASLEVPSVLDAFHWVDPLNTSVAADLAIHDRWAEAIAWTATMSDSGATTDALVMIAELAAAKKAPANVLSQIESAVPASDRAGSLRIRAAVAAASKDPAKLDACLAALEQIAAAPAATMPTSKQIVEDDVPDNKANLYRAVAVAEVVRAAVVCGRNEQAAAAMTRLWQELSAAAPPTVQLRVPADQMAREEAAFRRRLSAELLVSDENQFAPMFRSYRRHLEQLSAAAEDRRLSGILLISRIVRSGGSTVVQQAMSASAEFKQDLLLDEMSGLIAASARLTGQELPELFSPDLTLRQGRARFGKAELVIGIALVADQAWAAREQRLPDCLKAFESRAGTALPGLRQNLLCELVESVAKTSAAPEGLLTAIAGLQNGAWREEAYLIAGRVFADRKLDKQADAWIAGAKMQAMELVTLLYGVSLGILERPVPEPPGSSQADAVTPEKGKGG